VTGIRAGTMRCPTGHGTSNNLNTISKTMKTHPLRFLCAAALCVAAFVTPLHAAPAGTAFHYQGRLYDGSSVASGFHDFRFTLVDSIGAVVPTAPCANPLVVNGAWVTNGLFTTSLDFCGNAFNGDSRWLRVEVRPSGGGAFTALDPLQELKPTPYALRALSADSVANVPWGSVTGVPAGLADGVDNDTTYTAGQGLILSGGAFRFDTAFGDARYWKLTGNAGTDPAVNFLGTTDNQPLIMRVNNLGAFKLDVNRSIVGNPAVNTVDGAATGAIIAGGTGNHIRAATDTYFGSVTPTSYAIISGGFNNENYGVYSTVSGGFGNVVATNAGDSFIGGGYINRVDRESYFSAIAGGWGNIVGSNALLSFIGSGMGNRIETNAVYSVIGGGQGNRAGGQYSTVPGGRDNRAIGSNSLAAGRQAIALHGGSFVWSDDRGADFATTTTDQFLIRARNGVGIGTNAPNFAQLHVAAEGSLGAIRADSVGDAIHARNSTKTNIAWVASSFASLEASAGSVTEAALLIRRGSIKVSGAGVGSSTPAFIHRATVANSSGNSTAIDHPLCNDEPNAILIITPNWNPGGTGGTYNNHSTGVFYSGGRWRIFNQDLAVMPANAAFNVLVINQ
jgi:hypothetical protein